MLSFLKKLLGRRPAKPILTITDADFGSIQYCEPSEKYAHGGYWQMNDGWTVSYQRQEVSSASVPGDESGPSDLARTFILAKRADPESLWRIAEPEIRKLMEDWPLFAGLSPREAFHIRNIAMDTHATSPQGWEVCFQTNDSLKWVFFCLQLKGDEVLSNTIDT